MPTVACNAGELKGSDLLLDSRFTLTQLQVTGSLVFFQRSHHIYGRDHLGEKSLDLTLTSPIAGMRTDSFSVNVTKC